MWQSSGLKLDHRGKATSTGDVGRKFVRQAGILAAGCALGVAVAYAGALELRLHAGEAGLQSYAGRLRLVADRIADETTQAVNAISHDEMEFCSDLELTLMRDYTFRAQHIRDLGRTRDGALECTTGVGRLYPSIPTGVPDIVSGGMMIRRRIPQVVADRANGIEVEKDGVSIVFNPNLVSDLEEPPMHYAAIYFDEGHHHMLAVYGPDVPLSINEILSGKTIHRGGQIYESLCGTNKTSCMVVFESRSDVLSHERSLVRWLVPFGGLLGLLIAWLAIRIEQRRRSMESQLRRALRSESLTLVYQPIVDLATGKIVAAEALARWVDEDGESIGPEVFVALAEEKGFARDITRLVVGFAAEELADMLQTGSLRVSINIAPTDLADEDFFRYLKHCLEFARVHPSTVALELTERSLADHDVAVKAIGLLKSRGQRIYVDDFGVGYSNLASLHRLEVDGIKVDRAFTQSIGTEAVSSSVVPQILGMARQMGLAIVVEGIETDEQAAYFRKAGGGILGQGWLFGRPVTAAQFRVLFTAGK